MKGSRNNCSSPIQGRDGVIFDSRGMATAVAECLEDQFSPIETDDALRSHCKWVRRRVQLFRNTSFDNSIQPVSGNKLRTTVKHMKLNKTAGHDKVTKSMLTNLPRYFVNHLVVIFNSALRLRHFPESSKYVNVVTISKPRKDSKVPLNKRTINLLSSLV